MPVEVFVEYNDGSKETFYIPLRMMHYVKENPYPQVKRTILADWAWANPNYQFEIPKGRSTIKRISLDPGGLVADIVPDNNSVGSK